MICPGWGVAASERNDATLARARRGREGGDSREMGGCIVIPTRPKLYVLSSGTIIPVGLVVLMRKPNRQSPLATHTSRTIVYESPLVVGGEKLRARAGRAGDGGVPSRPDTRFVRVALERARQQQNLWNLQC